MVVICNSWAWLELLSLPAPYMRLNPIRDTQFPSKGGVRKNKQTYPRQKNFAKDKEFIANKRRSDYILSAVLHTIVKLYHERKKSIPYFGPILLCKTICSCHRDIVRLAHNMTHL